MRHGIGVWLVAVGLTWVAVTLDKLGLVVAFAGVTLLAARTTTDPLNRTRKGGTG